MRRAAYRAALCLLCLTLLCAGAEAEAGYLHYAALCDDLRAMADAYPELCALESLGRSVEGRELWALTLGAGEAGALTLAGVHGNEAANPPMLLRAAKELAARWAAGEERTRRAFEAARLTLVVCANPDGYERTLGYLERGRAYAVKGNAAKVNLNRNFPTPCWGMPKGAKESDNAGPSAGSEPETQALMALMESRAFSAMVDWHSKGRQAYYGKGMFEQAELRTDTEISLLDGLTKTLAEAVKPEAYRLRLQSGRRATGNGGSTTDYFFLLGAPAVTVETMASGDAGNPTLSRIEKEYALIDLPGCLLRLIEEAARLDGLGIVTRP